jgi:hypothetical protein
LPTGIVIAPSDISDKVWSGGIPAILVRRLHKEIAMGFTPNSIINWLIAALIFLGLAYIALYAITLYLRFRSGKFADSDAVMSTMANDISRAIMGIWLFARPIAQLIIVLFVVYWFAQTLGVTPKDITTWGVSDIKTVLAFFVIGAFCIAAFLSDNPASWLKDFALVVIGFYFGTKAGP